MQASLIRGTFLAILASCAITSMNIFVKLIGNSIPIYELIWIRFALSLILLIPIVFSKSFSFHLAQPFRFLGRTVAALLALVFLFIAVQALPLAEALLLANTTPLILPILAFLLRGAKTTKIGILGIVIGFIGVAIVLNPSHNHLGWGSLSALISAFFVALAILQIRILGKSMATSPMLFYYFLMSTLFMTPFGLVKIVIPLEPKLILFLLLMGVSGFIYQICSTWSYKLAPVRLTTPILYVNVLLGGLAEWFIWGHRPSLDFIIGCLIIIAGVLLTLFFGHPSTNSGDSYANK